MTNAATSSAGSWLKVVAFGSGARVFALGSQFVVLVLLGRLLDKTAFGDLMIAFAVYRILSYGIGTGLGNLVLVHTARGNATVGAVDRIHRTALLFGAGVTTLLAAALVATAPQAAAFFDKPGLALWLVHMSPMLVFGTLNCVTAGSLDGHSQITRSIVLNELAPNALRLLGFLVLPFVPLPPVAVAHVMWGALAIPWLFEAHRLLGSTSFGLCRFSGWDLRYVLSFTLQSFGSMQLQGIDLVVVGYLYSSADAANYALASRVAVFFPFFGNILAKKFTPLAASLFHAGRIGELQSEIDRLKRLNVMAVALNSAGCVAMTIVLTKFVMKGFDEALGLVVFLVTPQIARSFYFGVDRVMLVADLAFASAVVQYLSLANLLITSFVLANWIGVYAIPFAMLLSSLILNPLQTHHVRTRCDLRFAGLRDHLTIVTACAANVATVGMVGAPWNAAISIALLLSLTAVAQLTSARSGAQRAPTA